MKVIGHIFHAIWWAAVILTPLFAVWLASSLAVFLNGPLWVAILSGALLFPGLPLIWEAWATRRFNRKQVEREAAGKKVKKAWFGVFDRLIFRTLFINILALVVLVGSFPKQSFSALSTRGDWFLDHASGHLSENAIAQTRGVVFGIADALEWVHNATRDNPYETNEDTPDPDVDPEPGPNPNEVKVKVPLPIPTPGPDRPEPPDPTKPEYKEVAIWPQPAELHPVVANMPASAETSPEAVARYIAERETDPYMRVKALHDWVADRVRYDLNAKDRGQTAEAAFETRASVCAGYSKLFALLGSYTGDEIVYVVGVSRDINGEVQGVGHAWNAVKIEGAWYLVDVTWNAGYYENGQFKKVYRTDYLFTPPQYFNVSHFPDNPEWQLVPEPISRGEWMRRPMISPAFYAKGLSLISPTRSQSSVDVSDTFEVILGNAKKLSILANIEPKGGGKSYDCTVKGKRTSRTRISCKVPAAGTWHIKIFAGEGVTLPYVGQVEVVAR